jgi:quercetin dioxygenase-like cupin family protein
VGQAGGCDPAVARERGAAGGGPAYPAAQASAGALRLKLTGLVPPGGRHHRQVLFDEIERRLPRDPDARINVNVSELMPGQAADWHVHNGPVWFLVVQGIVTLEYQSHVEHYQSGEVYTEPIGVVHRARNPHTGLPAAFVGFWVTAADRPHLTAVAEPPWTPPRSQHPYLQQAEQLP